MLLQKKVYPFKKQSWLIKKESQRNMRKYRLHKTWKMQVRKDAKS